MPRWEEFQPPQLLPLVDDLTHRSFSISEFTPVPSEDAYKVTKSQIQTQDRDSCAPRVPLSPDGFSEMSHDLSGLSAYLSFPDHGSPSAFLSPQTQSSLGSFHVPV